MAAAVIAGVLTGLAETSGSCQTENAQNEMENIKRVNFIAAIANEGYWGRAADGAIQTGSQKNMDVKNVWDRQIWIHRNCWIIWKFPLILIWMGSFPMG